MILDPNGDAVTRVDTEPQSSHNSKYWLGGRGVLIKYLLIKWLGVNFRFLKCYHLLLWIEVFLGSITQKPYLRNDDKIVIS